MTWSTLETEHEGFPLLLRRPDYEDIWKLRKQYPELILIEHLLDKVDKNGLPKKTYNKTLAEFDDAMCSLFDKTGNGIIFLIETFAGRRNYFYYANDVDLQSIARKIKRKYKMRLETTSRPDKKWSFITKYPIEIFPSS